MWIKVVGPIMSKLQYTVNRNWLLQSIVFLAPPKDGSFAHNLLTLLPNVQCISPCDTLKEYHLLADWNHTHIDELREPGKCSWWNFLKVLKCLYLKANTLKVGLSALFPHHCVPKQTYHKWYCLTVWLWLLMIGNSKHNMMRFSGRIII